MARGREAHELLEQRALLPPLAIFILGGKYTRDGRRTYPAATLYDLRESVATLEELERTMRRVLGGAHPLTMQMEISLQKARAALRARETPSPGSA